MNLAALQQELYRRLSYTTSPPSTITTRLTSFLNITHRQLVGAPGMEPLRNDTITFASVSGQVYYGLPPTITRVEAITDRTTMLRLRALSLSDIRDMDPGLVTSGLTDSYVLRGYQQVAVQPAVATGLWAVSTSAADTQNAFVETIRTGGYPSISAATALTGVTRKQFGTLTDHIEVVKFYVSPAAAGEIRLFDAAAAGNELARIPIGGTYARYLQVQLFPTPTSAITYYVDYVRTIADMSNSTDEPLLPDDFHWLLVEGALAKEYAITDNGLRSIAEQTYNRGVSALKYFVNCQADFLPSRRPTAMGISRFGAHYPVTRY